MSEIKDIGGTIKWLRIQRGFTQKQLGDKMGFDKSTISRLERDATPYKLEDLIKIATELGTDLSDILRGTPQPKDYQVAAIKSFIKRFDKITTVNEYFKNKDSSTLNPEEFIFSLLASSENPVIIQLDENLLDFVRDIAEIEDSRRESEQELEQKLEQESKQESRQKSKQKLAQKEYDNRIALALRQLNKSEPTEEINTYCLASIQDIKNIIDKAVKKEVDASRALMKQEAQETVSSEKES